MTIVMYIQVQFAHLPQQRHLDHESKKKVLTLMITKRLLQQHLTETDQLVTLLDDSRN